MRNWHTVHKRAKRQRRREVQRRQFARALDYVESSRFAALDHDIQQYVLSLVQQFPHKASELHINWALWS